MAIGVFTEYLTLDCQPAKSVIKIRRRPFTLAALALLLEITVKSPYQSESAREPVINVNYRLLIIKVQANLLLLSPSQ